MRVIVAAVGNNGPAGEPLYPAAYEAVVAVTAVDSANQSTGTRIAAAT